MNKCPDCNAHWIDLEDGTRIIVPNHRLPRIEHSDGNVQYLDQEYLIRAIAETLE